MRKCFSYLFLCIFECRIRFLHLEVIFVTLKGSKLQVSAILVAFFVYFRKNSLKIEATFRRRLDGPLGRFRLKIECRLRLTYF